MSGHAAPPVARSRLWRQINQAAAEGEFRLQACAACRHVQYPPQEFCSRCLSGDLAWETASPLGKVLSWTRVRASNHPFFRDRLPLHTGLVKLDCGPVMFVYLAASCLQAGRAVQVAGLPDKSGQTVFIARAPDTDLPSEFNEILMEEVTHDTRQ